MGLGHSGVTGLETTPPDVVDGGVYVGAVGLGGVYVGVGRSGGVYVGDEILPPLSPLIPSRIASHPLPTFSVTVEMLLS